MDKIIKDIKQGVPSSPPKSKGHDYAVFSRRIKRKIGRDTQEPGSQSQPAIHNRSATQESSIQCMDSGIEDTMPILDILQDQTYLDTAQGSPLIPTNPTDGSTQKPASQSNAATPTRHAPQEPSSQTLDEGHTTVTDGHDTLELSGSLPKAVQLM